MRTLHDIPACLPILHSLLDFLSFTVKTLKEATWQNLFNPLPSLKEIAKTPSPS